jgi:molybdopterin/thiamine biosynthesis adenylyltransferase
MSEESPFLRQLFIPQWNQELVERQVALVLGTGGLGFCCFNIRNTVALDCCRLGFQKIILLDYDVVDNHNLNRQILFSKKDVGRSKVEAAAEALEHHNIRYKLLSHRRSTIETVHLDAVQNWPRVVELARESTVIFNLVLSSCLMP